MNETATASLVPINVTLEQTREVDEAMSGLAGRIITREPATNTISVGAIHGDCHVTYKGEFLPGSVMRTERPASADEIKFAHEIDVVYARAAQRAAGSEPGVHILE